MKNHEAARLLKSVTGCETVVEMDESPGNQRVGKCYYSCLVPGCTNTSISVPDKIFIGFPRSDKTSYGAMLSGEMAHLPARANLPVVGTTLQ